MPRFHPSPSRMDVSIAKFFFLRVLLTYGLLWSTPDRISIMRLCEMLFRNEWAYLGREWCTFQGERFNYSHQFTFIICSIGNFCRFLWHLNTFQTLKKFRFQALYELRVSLITSLDYGYFIRMQIRIFYEYN